MCLLIANPLGAEISREHLDNAWQSNPHGGGFAYFKDGKLILDKGYFDFEEFYESYQKTLGFASILHVRWATSGLKNKDNCHPFVVSENEMENDRKEIEKEPTLILAHNGVISAFSHKTKDMSDTYSFIKEILTPMSADCEDKWYRNSSIKTRIENVIGGGNKLAAIDNEGEITIFNQDSGEWLDEDAQIWASNGSYHTIKQRPSEKHNAYGGQGYKHQTPNHNSTRDAWDYQDIKPTIVKDKESSSSSDFNPLTDIPPEELPEVDAYLDILNNPSTNNHAHANFNN